jgi:ankyrin repeat protein
MPADAESGEEPLLLAAAAGDRAAVDAAIAALPRGRKATAVRDARGRDALHLAAADGHAVLAAHLVDKRRFDVGALDAAGATPLAAAVGRGHLGAVEALLARGADARGAGPSGPLLLTACTVGAADVAAALMAAGADPNRTASTDGMPVLFMAASSAALMRRLPGREAEAAAATAAVTALLVGGADANAAAPGGFRPLHVAAEAGSLEMIEALLGAGADAAARGDDGAPASATAASWGHRDAALRLLRAEFEAAGGKGAPPDEDDVAELCARMEAEAAARRREAAEAEAARRAAGGAPEGEDAEAAEAAARARVPEPEDPNEEAAEALKAQGNAAFAEGRDADALALYRAALRHRTDSAPLWANAAAAALRLGRAADALRDARVARTVDKAYVKAWYREGKAAEALEMWYDAAGAYFEAHMLESPSGEAAKKAKAGVDFAGLTSEMAARARAEERRAAKAKAGA